MLTVCDMDGVCNGGGASRGPWSLPTEFDLMKIEGVVNDYCPFQVPGHQLKSVIVGIFSVSCQVMLNPLHKGVHVLCDSTCAVELSANRPFSFGFNLFFLERKCALS